MTSLYRKKRSNKKKMGGGIIFLVLLFCFSLYRYGYHKHRARVHPIPAHVQDPVVVHASENLVKKGIDWFDEMREAYATQPFKVMQRIGKQTQSDLIAYRKKYRKKSKKEKETCKQEVLEYIHKRFEFIKECLPELKQASSKSLKHIAYHIQDYSTAKNTMEDMIPVVEEHSLLSLIFQSFLLHTNDRKEVVDKLQKIMNEVLDKNLPQLETLAKEVGMQQITWGEPDYSSVKKEQLKYSSRVENEYPYEKKCIEQCQKSAEQRIGLLLEEEPDPTLSNEVIEFCIKKWLHTGDHLTFTLKVLVQFTSDFEGKVY